MTKRNDMLKSVEDYSRFRDALKDAVEPKKTEPETEQGLDELTDDSQVGLTDSMMMYAGISVSQIGIAIGVEAPTSLEQLHKRGETFLYASLGATALYAVIDATQKLI